MARTISVAQLGHGGASRAIREAQSEPVLVSKENRPAAWIVGAERLAQVAAARTGAADVYQDVLATLAVELYQQETLTIGQAARLASLPLGDFVDLCGRLGVPVLWGPPGGVAQDADALEAALSDQRTG